jgi:hypothetical protein
MRSLSVLVTTALLLLSPSTARADETTVNDAAADVYGSVPEGFEQVEPVGTHVNTDLRRTLVDHRAHALVASVRYDDLAKRASTYITYQTYLNLPSSLDDISLRVDIKPSLRRATVRVLDTFGDVACPGARATVKPARDKLKVRVPRSCLGDPSWIRYRGDAESWDEAGRFYVDYDNTTGSQAEAAQQTEKLYAA